MLGDLISQQELAYLSEEGFHVWRRFGARTSCGNLVHILKYTSNAFSTRINRDAAKVPGGFAGNDMEWPFPPESDNKRHHRLLDTEYHSGSARDHH